MTYPLFTELKYFLFTEKLVRTAHLPLLISSICRGITLYLQRYTFFTPPSKEINIFNYAA